MISYYLTENTKRINFNLIRVMDVEKNTSFLIVANQLKLSDRNTVIFNCKPVCIFEHFGLLRESLGLFCHENWVGGKIFI